MTNIYLISNTKNTVVYIGKTKYSIVKRFIEHLYTSIKTSGKAYTKPLYKMMRDLGQENFRITLLEECNDDIASIRECYWIDQYSDNCNENRPYAFSKEQLQEMIKTRSLRDIAREYNVDHSSIKFLVNKYRLTRYDIYRSYPELTKEKLYEEYVTNKKSIAQITKEYDVLSKTTIQQRLKKYNIRRP